MQAPGDGSAAGAGGRGGQQSSGTPGCQRRAGSPEGEGGPRRPEARRGPGRGGAAMRGPAAGRRGGRAPRALRRGGGAALAAVRPGRRRLVLNLTVPFRSLLEAHMAHRALIAGAQRDPGVIREEYTVNGSALTIRWTAEDLDLFRISIDSIFDQLSRVIGNIQHLWLPPP
ncbi:EKC/KEOPS complex subunit LAGE3-like [Balaenoptera musculus]|uniref:L antigen family member 3 n=1 Tax=Balaenoptera musculus TaxID=9771 RepID=A0A8B8WI26_BALMU|nr:EKC/KEOPS complex subunit LAGE3-like [Balaenoptera musculus]